VALGRGPLLAKASEPQLEMPPPSSAKFDGRPLAKSEIIALIIFYSTSSMMLFCITFFENLISNR